MLSFTFETTRLYRKSSSLRPSPFAFVTDGNHFFFILLIFVPFFSFLFFESLWISLFTFKLQQTWSNGKLLPLLLLQALSAALPPPLVAVNVRVFVQPSSSFAFFAVQVCSAFTVRVHSPFTFVWKPRCPASNSATNPCAPPSRRTALFCRRRMLLIPLYSSNGCITCKVRFGILADGTLALRQVLIQVPGIVFARGPAVTMLILLESDGETYAVLTEQARVPTGRIILELPAGMTAPEELAKASIGMDNLNA